MKDYLASRAFYASIYSELKPFEPGEPKPKFPYSIGFFIEGKNDHLPVTKVAKPGGSVPHDRFMLSSRHSVPVVVPDGKWRDLKDVFDHLDVCNMGRDLVFRHTDDLVLEVNLFQSEGYQTPIVTLKRIIIDPSKIDTVGLFA